MDREEYLSFKKNILNDEISTSVLLKKAKVIATQLNQKDAIEWIDLELNGYQESPENKIPPYRYIVGIPVSYNSTHKGWFSISFQNPTDKKHFSRVCIDWPLSLVEDAMIKNKEGIAIPVDHLTRHVKQDSQVRLNSTTLKSIVDKVRNRVLDWILKLEKAGIFKGELANKKDDKKQMVIHNNYNISGNNINGDLKIENNQNASPEKKNLSTDLPSRKSWHKSLRSVFENVIGNITSQGIIDLLKKWNIF